MIASRPKTPFLLFVWMRGQAQTTSPAFRKKWRSPHKREAEKQAWIETLRTFPTRLEALLATLS